MASECWFLGLLKKPVFAPFAPFYINGLRLGFAQNIGAQVMALLALGRGLMQMKAGGLIGIGAVPFSPGLLQRDIEQRHFDPFNVVLCVDACRFCICVCHARLRVVAGKGDLVRGQGADLMERGALL